MIHRPTVPQVLTMRVKGTVPDRAAWSLHRSLLLSLPHTHTRTQYLAPSLSGCFRSFSAFAALSSSLRSWVSAVRWCALCVEWDISLQFLLLLCVFACFSVGLLFQSQTGRTVDADSGTHIGTCRRSQKKMGAHCESTGHRWGTDSRWVKDWLHLKSLTKGFEPRGRSQGNKGLSHDMPKAYWERV